MGISERKKEIKRRRHRRKKLVKWDKKLSNATVSEKTDLAAKIRQLTPGCDVIIERWQLSEVDR